MEFIFNLESNITKKIEDLWRESDEARDMHVSSTIKRPKFFMSKIFGVESIYRPRFLCKVDKSEGDTNCSKGPACLVGVLSWFAFGVANTPLLLTASFWQFFKILS